MVRWRQTAACCALLWTLSLTAEVGQHSPVDAYLEDATRLKQCKALLGQFEAPLSPEDQQRCLSYLERPIAASMLAQERVKKNDLADWMLQRPSEVNATTELLLTVIADESRDLIWREYCVQKLAMAASQSALRDDLKDACRTTLEQMAAETRISFAGTALLGLYRMHRSGIESVDAGRVIQLCEQVLQHSGYATANKVTALQVAGLLGSQQALVHARAVCADPGSSIQYRASAIALLGNQGTAGDVNLLQPMTESMDYRLRRASRIAIQRLQKTYDL